MSAPRHKPYGQTAECEPGYVAHSLCTSGHRADCPGNSHTNLECCRETEVPGWYQEQVVSQYVLSFEYSVLQYILLSFNCSCVPSVTFCSARPCCIVCSLVWMSIKLKPALMAERTACETLEGGYGSELECRTGQYVKAVCSSGWYDDCGSNVWNRISCCGNTRTHDTHAPMHKKSPSGSLH